RLPSRNSTPPNRCACLVTPSQEPTSRSIRAAISSIRAVLPASRRVAQEAPHRRPGQRDAPDGGGDGLRGLLRPRVDPLPPPVAVPSDRVRRVPADRPRRVGAGRPRASAPPHLGRGAG